MSPTTGPCAALLLATNGRRNGRRSKREQGNHPLFRKDACRFEGDCETQQLQTPPSSKPVTERPRCSFQVDDTRLKQYEVAKF
jgi:hypothetical protein